MLCMPLIPFLCLECSQLHMMRLHMHLQMPCYSHLAFWQQVCYSLNQPQNLKEAVSQQLT